METKLHRIKKAIAWLHSREIITKQKDIAAAMQMNVSSLSRALNGDEQYLTDSFLYIYRAKPAESRRGESSSVGRSEIVIFARFSI